MEPESANSFEQFFATKIKERNISLKKLAEATGVAPAHIEGLLRGDFDSMPSAPYLRGYLIRLGVELGFNGEEWWKRLLREGVIKNSGASDTLPRNRFMREAPPKYLWAIGIAALVIIYLIFEAPHILGRPTLTIIYPDTNPYTTTSSTVTLSGTVSDASALYLNGSQPITINPDGSWSETVLLGAGPNPFEISAKKFLGSQTNVTENIVYEPIGGVPQTATGTASTTPASTTPGSPSSSGNPSAL